MLREKTFLCSLGQVSDNFNDFVMQNIIPRLPFEMNLGKIELLLAVAVSDI